MANSKSSAPQNRMIMSGEGLVKAVVPAGAGQDKSTTNVNKNLAAPAGTTIDREYQNFEAEELGIEQEVASKIRLLGKERKSATIDRSEALLQLSMRPKENNH